MPDPTGSGHRGTRAVQRLVEFAPATGGLALWVRHEDVDASEADPIATDGTTVRYGPGFAALDLELQAGLVAHQVLHVGLRHAQRFVELQRRIGDVDLRLFNICADAIVNSTLGALGWLRLPAGSVHLERLLEHALSMRSTADEALLAWDVESLYRAIDDRGRDASRASANDGRTTTTGRSASPQEGDGRGRPDGPKASAARAFGSAIVADLRPAPTSSPENEAESARTWNERLVRAHADDAAFSLLRTLPADLPQSRTPWEQVLRTRLARSLSSRPTLSWSRPTRSWLANQGRAGPRGSRTRLPWEPGSGGLRPVPRLAVIVDVSGSIDDDLLQRFASEIRAITRRLEAGLVVVVGDDRVRRVTCFEPGRGHLDDLACEGGGGTDFTPLLEEADRHRPDIGVVLTDLDGPARFAPSWPVLWAVPEAYRASVPPFGRTLVLR